MDHSQPSFTIHNVRVESVIEHFTDRYQSGSGPTYKAVKVSLGWFILLEGSHEALYLGREKPDFAAGDRVSITIRKETK